MKQYDNYYKDSGIAWLEMYLIIGILYHTSELL